jgi:sugar phosphate permease
VGLSLWGVFKGSYESNIFASAYDVVPPEVRGTAAGFMNLVGWLGGAGTAPVLVGVLAGRIGLDRSVAVSSAGCGVACIVLSIAALKFARQDTKALALQLACRRAE